MFIDNIIWKQIQQHLPEHNRISEKISLSEKKIIFNDIEIRYDEYFPKKPSTTTVVIFHGVGGNGRLLSFIAVPLVKAGYNVICPDLPGYGYTKIKKSFNYSTWIEVGSIITKKEVKAGKNVYILGLSAGGMLGYNIACKVKNIKGLIITNLLDNRLQIVRDYSARNKFHSRIGIKLLYLLPGFMKRINIPVKTVVNMKAIVNKKEVLSLLLKDKVGSGSSVSIEFLLSMMKSNPLLEPEEFSICPVLLTHPEIDKWTPVEISRLFFDKLNTEKKLILLENAGHFPIESPGLQQLETACIEFISK